MPNALLSRPYIFMTGKLTFMHLNQNKYGTTATKIFMK